MIESSLYSIASDYEDWKYFNCMMINLRGKKRLGSILLEGLHAWGTSLSFDYDLESGLVFHRSHHPSPSSLSELKEQNLNSSTSD
ncbi:unnamed protein product [Prunus armeniaca]